MKFSRLKAFIAGKTEYVISFIAAAGWLLIYLFSYLFGIETYPIGYFQKIFFGVLAMTLISSFTFFWAKKTLPTLGEMLDPDNGNYKKFTPWQQLKVSLFFFAFYGFGTVLLASLY